MTGRGRTIVTSDRGQRLCDPARAHQIAGAIDCGIVEGMRQLGRRFQIPNGRAKGRRASEFDPVQLRRGTKVEMEHTRDPRIAARIAMDHLVEDPAYYQKLARIHLDGGRLARRTGRQNLGLTCTNSPRWIRGGVGLLMGGVLGAMIGGGIASVMVTSVDITSPVKSALRIRQAPMVAVGVALVGGVGGLIIGAAKPEC